jgi:hypothetical protein
MELKASHSPHARRRRQLTKAKLSVLPTQISTVVVVGAGGAMVVVGASVVVVGGGASVVVVGGGAAVVVSQLLHVLAHFCLKLNFPHNDLDRSDRH